MMCRFLCKLAAISFCAALALSSGCVVDLRDDETEPQDPDDPGGEPPDSPRDPDEPGESWTVLVYMVADNNLEPFGLEDLEEMAVVGDAVDFRIVVQADRAADYTDGGVGNLPGWEGTKRLLVRSGDIEALADLGEQNMGDPAVLSDFIAWAVDAYPADRYALVFWDHGAGWPGFGGDESTADHDTLSVSELQQGIANGLSRAGLEALDLIGFDACLMATYEVAVALRPFGSYLLASEELEPGHGWNYERLSAIRDDPTLGPVALGTALMEGFRDQATFHGTAAGITLSLTDLRELDALEAAVADLASKLTSELHVAAPQIGRQREAALRFAEAPDPAQATNMVDLGDFAARLAQGHAPLQDAGSRILDALEAAVVTRVAGPLSGDARGLSIYFPPQRDYYDIRYEQLADSRAWDDFLQRYYDMGSSGGFAPPTFTNPDRLADVVFYEDGIAIYGDLAPDGAANVAKATLGYGFVDTTQDIVFLLGDQPAAFVDSSAGGFWDYSTLTITQGNRFGYLYASFDKTPTGDLSIAIPFAYQPPGSGQAYYLLLVYIVAPDGLVLQETYYLLTDAGPGELTPQPGALMTPLVVIIDQNGYLDWGFGSGDSFDPTLGFDLAFEYLPAGILGYVELLVSDFAGNQDYVYFEGAI